MEVFIFIFMFIWLCLFAIRAEKTNKKANHKKTQGMLIGTTLNNPSEGYIFYENFSFAPIKCIIERNKVYVDDRCNGCGSNQVKDYKCAHCNAELKYNKYSKRI